MSYTKLEMYAYAAGYHDGRNDYEVDNYWAKDDPCSALYTEGYTNGVEDRTEQDERV